MGVITTRRPVSALAAAAMFLSGAVVAAQPGRAAADPGPDTLPITFTNNTGSSEPIYIQITATDNTDSGSDNLGYVDSAGTFHNWPATSGSDPVDAPDISIDGPSQGKSTTINVPTNVSGRIYYSVGEKMQFQIVGTDGGTGLVQPAPWADGDASASKFFDWTEFTYNGSEKEYPGLWLNSTQVDQFAIPATVGVTSGSGDTKTAGTMTEGGRQKVIDALANDSAWADTVVKDDSGKVLRVLAPGHAASVGKLSSSYLDQAISDAWSAYSSKTLTVAPFSDRPDTKFSGTTSGDVMTFTDGSGAEVATFNKPSSADVWGCDGNLAAPNDDTVGPIARTLCAGLNRGTLGGSDTEPVTDPAQFYKNTEGLNLYAKSLHSSMADGKAYAFAFDDVAAQASIVEESNPTSASIDLQPLG